MTYFVQRKLDKEREEDQKAQLRKGLLHELKSMDELECWEGYAESGIPPHRLTVMDFYLSNCDKMSLLSEVSSVIDFYSRARLVEEIRQYAYSVEASGDQLRPELRQTVENNITDLQSKKSTLTCELKNNLEDE